MVFTVAVCGASTDSTAMSGTVVSRSPSRATQSRVASTSMRRWISASRNCPISREKSPASERLALRAAASVLASIRSAMASASSATARSTTPFCTDLPTSKVGIAFGPPRGSRQPAQASYVPLFAHLALVLIAGVYLPAPLVTWFQHVAKLLG